MLAGVDIPLCKYRANVFPQMHALSFWPPVSQVLSALEVIVLYLIAVGGWFHPLNSFNCS